jgi:hypothetical protein
MKTWRPGEDDEFDIAIDGKWRTASREEPPAHVDAAILAAARTRRPWLTTWQPLAAAAAVAGLAFLLVQLRPSERTLEQPIRMEPEQPAAAPSGQARTSELATMGGTTEAAPAEPRIRDDESRARDQRTAEPAVAVPHAPPEAAASRSDAMLEPRQLSIESQAAGALSAGAPAPVAAAKEAAARAESSLGDSPSRELPPAQWATLIEALHASGDLAAAAAQLRAFRAQHADADRLLPEAIREWASTVE